MDIETIEKEIYLPLMNNGFHAYLVGGCVRDKFLGRTPHDYDVVTDAMPKDIKDIFPNSFGTGENFLVMNVPIKGELIEVATFRVDGKDRKSVPSAAKGTLADKFQQDANRRDFTINAIYYDFEIKGYISPILDCTDDLINKKIRFVGDPQKRIEEDPLRVLRAFRFMATLGFDLAYDFTPPKGWADKIAGERIGIEMTKMANGNYFYKAMREMDRLRILDDLIPEWKPMRDCICPPQWHTTPNAAEHTFGMLEEAGKVDNFYIDRFTLNLSTFFHDIGKPVVQTPDGRAKGHADVSAMIAEDILKMRWHINYDIANKVIDCVQNHMNMHDLHKKSSSAEIWKFLQERPSKSTILELLRLDNLDLTPGGHPDSFVELTSRPTFSKMDSVKLPKTQFDGNELMKYVSPGKHFQAGLDFCYMRQLEKCVSYLFGDYNFDEEEKVPIYKQAAAHVKQLRRNNEQKASV